MKQKEYADKSDHRTFFQQSMTQILNRATDQLGTIINRLYTDARWQTCGDFAQPVFYIINDFQRILSIARQGNARNRFTFAVQFGDTAPLIGNQFHTRNIAYQYRNTIFDFQYQVLQIHLSAQITMPTHHIFSFGKFNNPSADIAVTVAYCIA